MSMKIYIKTTDSLSQKKYPRKISQKILEITNSTCDRQRVAPKTHLNSHQVPLFFESFWGFL